ncbi:MAG: TniQ family protein [Pseudomonadota bacterium]
MKMRLPKGVKTFPNEPCFSFLVRLAERNDISAFELASVSGTRWPNVKIGSHQAVRECAALAGIDPFALRRATPRLIDKRLYGFVGATLPDRLTRSVDLRFCPSCAQEDVDAGHQPYIRSEWLLRAFRVCPVHQTPLIDLCSIDHLKYDCLSQTIARRLEDHRPGQNTRRDRPAFEQYLTSRINRVWPREKRWVDTMSLESLVESAELFGALLRLGRFKKSELGYDDWVAAAELGFSILRNGKDEFFQKLARHTLRSEKQSLIGYTQCFGHVYAWLNTNRENPKHKEIVAAIHEFAERSLRTEHLNMFLGRPLIRIEGCSVTRLAQVFGIPPKRVRVFLARSDVEPIGSIDTIMGQAVLYPDGLARQAVRKWLDLIDGQEARQLLDVKRSTFHSLVEHKIVRQHRFKSLRGPRYSTKSLISLCRRFEKLQNNYSEQDCDAIRGHLESLSSAARRVPCEIGELFRLHRRDRQAGPDEPRHLHAADA